MMLCESNRHQNQVLEQMTPQTPINTQTGNSIANIQEKKDYKGKKKTIKQKNTGNGHFRPEGKIRDNCVTRICCSSQDNLVPFLTLSPIQCSEVS